MTDFYSVLRNALDRVGAVDDAGARDRVYAHARDGMVRRLQRQDPPLSENVIADRVDDFETAVARIEEEIAESVFAEADFAPEPQPQPAYAGEWSEPAAEAPREPAPTAEPAATPESTWNQAAIDLAWDETTEQWQDPVEGLPPSPRLPVGGWEERLGFALSDDRRSHQATGLADSYDEADEEDAPVAGPATPRRSRFSRLRRRRPAGPSLARQPAADPEPEPEPPTRQRWRLPRWRSRATVGAEPTSPYAPVPDADLSPPANPGVRPRRPLARSAPAERAMFYLEDRTLQADAAAIVAAAREAHVIDVEFEEDEPGFHPADVGFDERRPRRSGPSRRSAAGAADVDDGPGRSRAGRVLTIAISVLALIVAVWCGYVFLPLIFPNDGAANPAEVSADQPAAVAATAPADGTIVLFAGEDPTVFEGGPDNPVRYEVDDAGGYVRLASSTTGSFRAIIGPGVAERLGGNQVWLIMEVRADPARPSSSMRIGYLRGTRLLEWRTIGLGTAFETATLEWDIPAGAGNVADALIIEPGIPGDGTALDIRSLRMQVLE